MQIETLAKVTTVLTLSTLMTLVACDRRTDDDRTVGQKVDATVEKIEQKADQAAASANKAMEQTKAVGAEAVDTAAAKLRDATITTSIKAELARDKTLSALAINVDTKDGRVSLNGTAPSAADRDRVTLMAKGVDGVVDVDNKLQIKN